MKTLGGYLLTPRTERFVTRAAASRLPKLLEGESGTGKTLLARIIHDRSPRRRGPLVIQGCGSFNESLAEDTLYGHERGAFTGAHVAKPGIFEAASGGTLVLNDLDALPTAVQAKMLDIFDTEQVVRLGSSRPIPVDVHIIFTINKDPVQMVRDGGLREDLFYRIAALRHKLPPLSQRRRDLPRLARMTLQDLWERSFSDESREPPRLSEDALALFLDQAWPGNLRDLRWVLARCLLNSCGATIGAREVGRVLSEGLPLGDIGSSDTGQGKATRYRRNGTLEDERRMLMEALKKTEDNMTRAAQLCGMSRTSFWMKMHMHNIRR